MGFHLTATGSHLPYGITQCYLLPDTSERAPPYEQRAILGQLDTAHCKKFAIKVVEIGSENILD